MAIECRRGNMDRAKEVLATWSETWHVPNWKWVSSKVHPLWVATRSSLPRSCCFNYCFLSPLKMPVNVSSKMSLNHTHFYHIFMVEFIPSSQWIEDPLPEESMKEAGWPPDVTSYRIMLQGYMAPWYANLGCDWVLVRTELGLFLARWWGGRYQQ